jgi:hypothetical protein
MTIHVLIDKLHHAGISLTASTTGLKIVAAPGIVTPDILDEIRANKPALIAALSEPPKNDLQAPRLNVQPSAVLPGTRANISPVALSWLLAHRQALKDAGWTGRELYRRNKSKGICWCSLWDEPFLKVYLHDNGVIEFECVIAGKDIIQTARPMHQARKIIRRK